jgi:SAM-dependent methyltransferase
MHPEAWDWIAKHIGTPESVIDLGGRDVNGHPRSLAPWAFWTVVDIEWGHGVDVVADAADWQPPEPVDLVICAEVLEHTPRAREIVANATTMLKPGGTLILTAAGPDRAPHSAIDGGPVHAGEWYCNVSADDLTAWLNLAPKIGPTDIEYGRGREDVYAVTWMPAR